MKKTKIVATIGPATESEAMLTKLLEAGMNVMRLNFSHGDFKEHQDRVNNLRKAMKKTGMPAAILQDLGGPKIRIGMFKTDSVMLKVGQTFTLTTDKIEGDENIVSINYPLLPKEVQKGHIIFLHDGKKKLQVTDIKGNNVVCKVLVGGDIKGKRGVNLPDSDLSIKALTDKDLADLEFGIKNKVDYVALSFVRRPSDITELREILNKRKCDAGIIAKIETPQAIENIDEIIALCDGIMVARGDLAIEVPYAKVPMMQKMMIEKCNALGKPIITATQMMESMIKSPVATRAEVSDVANAIIDGTDAVMLSEETTLGEFSVEAVTVMATVAEEIESEYSTGFAISETPEGTLSSVDALSAGVVNVAEDTASEAIIVLSDDASAAQMVSRFKASMPVIAATTNERTYNKLSLSWGVTPLLVKKAKTFAEALKGVKAEVVKMKVGSKGDTVSVLGSMDQKGEANILFVDKI
ncbi:MAG: pyruvate kinase [Candidatus Zambryskibacteria bacterium]|nr:pyruvate kinase [Candidatus Zambryskibacteria bacterium]